MRSTKNQRTRGADHVEQAPVPKAQRTRGAPPTYADSVIPEAAALAQQGLTDKEIAEQLGVHVSTFWRWFTEHPELREAVRAAGKTANNRVKMSLYTRAIEGSDTASIFWLKNREPDEWRDRKETEIIVPVDENTDAPDVRQLALQGLALFNAAVYDQDEQLQGLVIEGHAREEIDHGANRHERAAGAQEAFDPDFDEPDGARDTSDFDLDPGEI